MLPTLPQKYYLAHADELFGFVGDECGHLLQDEHAAYLNGFADLNQDAQCLLVRCLTRKPRFLARTSLDYTEIVDIEAASKQLASNGYVSVVRADDWPDFIHVLTKPQLMDCLNHSQVGVKAAAPKAELLGLVADLFSGDEAVLRALRTQYLVRRKQVVIDYILFLFFGDLRNRFQKFAMRDLGVLKTRKIKRKQVPRFASKEEAISAFTLQYKRREFKQAAVNVRGQVQEELVNYLMTEGAVGVSAKQTRDKLIVSVGNELVTTDPERAIELLRHSDSPEATERWVRESYKHLDRNRLKQELEQMRSAELAAPCKIFVEDFYTRKYLGKRTSVFTDMLREPTHTLPIDEVYINDVEQGVINCYHRQADINAWFTENSHWRVLFAFTFWELLFGRQQLQVNEFDRLPLSIRNGSFYADNVDKIEQCLSLLASPDRARTHFSKIATRHYGYPTGIFRWRAELLDSVLPCITFSPPGAIANVLRRMAQDFRNTRDGYPDLMVVADGALRFEEVKAPGDVLRPNQLVSINRLRRAGFQVDVSQVCWETDPNQDYAVVDIETTGGRKGLHAITEVAVVKVRNGRIQDEWSTLVNPQRPIPANITRLTSISNQMVATAPIFQEIADELEVRLQDSIFVAHNVGFDYGFIKTAFEQMNRSFRKPKFCTVRNARKTFPGLNSYSLGKLTEALDIDLPNAHRALSDARATADLLIMIQDKRSRA